jgi:hypothetical protein
LGAEFPVCGTQIFRHALGLKETSQVSETWKVSSGCHTGTGSGLAAGSGLSSKFIKLAAERKPM